MKKTLIATAAALAASIALTACGGKKDDPHTLTIAATPVPHSEILEHVKPLLKAEGYDLDIKVVQDYIMPNVALANGDVDANYSQHLPYMNTVLEEHKGDPNYNFVNAGSIHLEPIGIYSHQYKSLKDLPNGAKILMRNTVSDEGRTLAIFQREGLITLKPGIPVAATRVSDVIDNPKHLDFRPNIEAAMLPLMYRNNEGDAVVINANFALGAGLDPVHDPIAVESPDNNPYVNIITVHRGHEHDPKIEALVKALHSADTQQFIRDKYKGAVIPVNN